MSNFLLDPQLYLYGKVKTPAISGQNIIADKYTYTVSSPTPGATIHYTIDGKDPTPSSSVLSGSLSVTHNTVLKVLATRPGFRQSGIATDKAIVTPRDPSMTNSSHGELTLTDININTGVGEAVTLQYRKSTDSEWSVYDKNNKPAFVQGDVVYSRSIRSGLSSPGTTSITIDLVILPPTFSITRINDAQATVALSGEAGATTYYRLDPTGTWLTYTTAITVSQHQTVYAYSSLLGKDSPVASQVIDLVPNSPEISINSVSGAVTITDKSTAGYESSIYYQVGGTSGSWNNYTTPFTANHGQTIYAKAVRQNLESSIVNKVCSIEDIAKPVITIDSATGNVTITCTTTLVSIYYTLDGSTPSTSSNVYTSTLTAKTHGTVVTAIAYKLGKSSQASKSTVSITLANPVITKTSESVADQTASVTISCSTANSSIYYTTNGTNPSVNSTQYTKAFTVNHGTPVKAIAVKLGNTTSASGTIYVTPKAPSISISSADGTVTITNNNTTGTIQYWTSSSSTKVTYSSPFEVNHGVTVYTTCTRNGLISSTASATCSIDLATPTISYNGDTGATTIACTTSGATLYYSTGDTDPKSGSVTSGSENFNHGTVVRAIAYKKGRWSSEATKTTVSINLNAPVITITTVSATAGTGSAVISVADTSGKTVSIEYSLDNKTWSAYSSAVSVDYTQTVYARATKLGRTTTASLNAGSRITLASASVSINGSGVVTFTRVNTGADVYYTTNNSNPTSSSTKWTSGTITVNHGTVVKVIEYRGTLTSAIATATCDISLASAVISYTDKSISDQTATVTITCSTADSTIYYTTDGSTPTTSSSVYSSALTVSHNAVVTAFTAKRGRTTSAVNKTVYVTPKDPTVSISSDTGVVTLADPNTNEAADIYYTTDGTSPSTNSTKWTGGTFAVTHGKTVKVIAIRHSLSSSVVSKTCSITLATPTITLSLLSTTAGTMTATVGNTTSNATYRIEVGNSPADPTEASAAYNSSSKPSVYHGQYIKVKGYKLGNTTSVVISAQANVVPASPTVSASLADKVTMTHTNTDTANVTIRYTSAANGGNPTDPTATTGTVYSGGISSSEDWRFEAITVRTSNGLVAISGISSATVPSTTYSITKTAEDVSAQTGTYKLSSTLAVDRIYYTTNGTTPTTSSSYVVNNGTITGVACDTTIKIKGYLNNVLDDETGSTTAYITPKAPSVSWSSIYNGNFTVTDNNTGDAASIYVTIDGTTPSATNTTTSRTASVPDGTVKAIAVRHGLSSSVTTSTHKVKITTPTIAWSSRAASSGGGQTATFAVTNATGVTFYYTTNGTTPTTSSSSVSSSSSGSSASVDFGTAGTYTLKVFAVKTNYTSSDVKTDAERSIYKLSKPVITKTAKAGGYTVKFECNTDNGGNTVAGVAIHYKDGTSVSVSDSSVSHNGTVSCTPTSQTSYNYRAIATKDNYVNSDNADVLSFTIYKLQAPVWGSFQNIENGKSIKVTAYSAYVNGSTNTPVSGVTTSYTAPTKTSTISGSGNVTENWTGTAYPSGKTLTATSSLDGYISASATTTLTLYKLSTPSVGSAESNTPGKKVKLTCATYITASGTAAVSNVKCHYTTNGTSDPTSSSSSVVSGNYLTLTSAGTYTVKAKGILSGYVSSDTQTGVQFQITQLSAPGISKTPVIGGYDVTYTSTNGYTLYYSINGGSSYSSETIGSTGTTTKNLRPTSQTTYTIWAYNRIAGYADSAVTKHTAFTVYKLAKPTINSPVAIAGGKSVKLECTKDTAGNTVASVKCFHSTGTATTSSSYVVSGSSVSYTPASQTSYTITSVAGLEGYITSDLTTGTAFTIYKLSKPSVSAESAIAAGKSLTFTCTSDTAGNTVSGVAISVTSSPTTAVSATSVSSGGSVTYKPTAKTDYTVVAKAKLNGYVDSDNSDSKALTVYKLAAPGITSSNITGGKRLTFSCSADTSGNSVSGIAIHYANGTPTTSSSYVSHNGTVDVKTAGSFNYKALATKDGYANSEVSTAHSFTLYKLVAPSYEVADVYDGKTLTWTNPGKYINGSSKTAVSGVTMVYQNATSGTGTASTTGATTSVSFTSNTYSGVTRTAYCQLSGYVTSDTTTSSSITVYQLATPTIADPVDYVGGKTVALSCSKDTAGNSVSSVGFRSTTNGTTPSSSSSSASTVTLSSAGTYTIWAMAVKNGYMNSAVAKDAAISVYKLELTYGTSSIVNSSGQATVTVTSKANGSNVNATIYYTSTSSGTVTATTSLGTTATGTKSWTSQSHGNYFSARATMSGYVGSDEKHYQLDVTPVAPTINVTQPDNSKTVTATITKNNTDSTTTIYYSLTGAASASSTVYSGEFTNFGTDPSAAAKIYACTIRKANGLSSAAAATSKDFTVTIVGDPTSGSAWMLAADTNSTSVIGTI